MPANPTTNSALPAFPTELVIPNVRTKEARFIQLVLLVYYGDPFPPEQGPQVGKTPTADPSSRAKIQPGSTAQEQVISSRVTTEARRYVLSKTLDELATPEAYDAMSRESSTRLTHLWLPCI